MFSFYLHHYTDKTQSEITAAVAAAAAAVAAQVQKLSPFLLMW